jgi:hypothetical protein
VVGQVRILQERARSTPEPFRAQSSSGFRRDVDWSLWWYSKNVSKPIPVVSLLWVIKFETRRIEGHFRDSHVFVTTSSAFLETDMKILVFILWSEIQIVSLTQVACASHLNSMESSFDYVFCAISIMFCCTAEITDHVVVRKIWIYCSSSTWIWCETTW